MFVSDSLNKNSILYKSKKGCLEKCLVAYMVKGKDKMNLKHLVRLENKKVFKNNGEGYATET